MACLMVACRSSHRHVMMMLRKWMGSAWTMECKRNKVIDPGKIRTPNLLIAAVSNALHWSQTRCRCATESTC